MTVHTNAKLINILLLLSKPVAVLCDPRLEILLAVTVAAADPIVGVGTGPSAPLRANAVLESSANPTEGGS